MLRDQCLNCCLPPPAKGYYGSRAVGSLTGLSMAEEPLVWSYSFFKEFYWPTNFFFQLTALFSSESGEGDGNAAKSVDAKAAVEADYTCSFHLDIGFYLELLLVNVYLKFVSCSTMLVRCFQGSSREDSTLTALLERYELLSEKVVGDTEVEKVVIDVSNLVDFVGKPVFHADKIYDQTQIRVVMGLAWTALGGSTLFIETTLIAHTVARAILLEKVLENSFFANSKLHLHVHAGAMPKDEPSAGCTMITSLLSLVIKRSLRKDLVMIGEVTLIRRILPIGGVKEKTIAARRSEVKTIIFPAANRRDFDELSDNMKEDLDVHFVDDYSHIFELVFGSIDSSDS
ncbi:hypothetical protein KFK09_015195 [Dendrobium nobile]|uniref:Lon proteolytic domain-containing protein n=1 Tax=Dendrobium nobile TaxID=94219 RepID=A0A8T3B5G6_DENNO|nr:hypothetical protein KFK09_015195 [Dendrobium nobile]